MDNSRLNELMKKTKQTTIIDKLSKEANSRDFLDKNLKPMIEQIQPKKTDSFILSALGLEEKPSEQSILIQFGTKLEKFNNKLISSSEVVENLIEQSNNIKIGNNKKQIDHLFKTKDNEIWYLESKCNLNFDTEKKPASNDKIKIITEYLKQQYPDFVINSGYLVPVLRNIPDNILKQYHEQNVYGMEWFLDKIGCLYFKVDEYFEYLKNEIKPVYLSKISNSS